ncbi:hypothetical protein COXBURSA331_A1742 [Coxiella burnetii RSA 331]|nr:hypothetical protein COXBURSA331_A1742 [Coxiella burnetii RSA 331]
MATPSITGLSNSINLKNSIMKNVLLKSDWIKEAGRDSFLKKL